MERGSFSPLELHLNLIRMPCVGAISEFLWTGRSTTVFVHILMASVAGLPVPWTYLGDSDECSHACEAANFHVIGGGSGAVTLDTSKLNLTT